MRFVLILEVLLSGLLARPVQAQTVAGDTARHAALQAAPLSGARLDSALAVHEVFKTGRSSARAFIIGGLLFIPAAAVLTAFIGGPWSHAELGNTGIIVSGAVSATGVAFGANAIGHFTRAKERAVLATYREGKPLPASVRKMLLASPAKK